MFSNLTALRALDGKTVEASLSSSQVFEQLSTHNRGRKERRELFGGTSTWTGPPAGGRGMGQPSHSQPQGAPAPFKQQSRGPPRDGGFPQGGRDFQGKIAIGSITQLFLGDRGDRVGMGGFNRGPPKSGGGFYGRGGGGVPISFPGDFGYGGGPGMFPGSYPVGMMPHINPVCRFWLIKLTSVGLYGRIRARRFLGRYGCRYGCR